MCGKDETGPRMRQWPGFKAGWPWVHSCLGPGSPFLWLDPLRCDHQWSGLPSEQPSGDLTSAGFSLPDFPPRDAASIILNELVAVHSPGSLCGTGGWGGRGGSLAGFVKREGGGREGTLVACFCLLFSTRVETGLLGERLRPRGRPQELTTLLCWAHKLLASSLPAGSSF